MRKIISLLLIITVLTCSSFSTFATESNNDNIDSSILSNQNLLDYLKEGNGKLLTSSDNYAYITFIQNFKSDALSLSALKATDTLIDTGYEPDKEKYMEILINIIATYDIDNANTISEQKQYDNLKTLKDYAMDFTKMGANAVSVMAENNPAVSKLETSISTAVNRLSVLKENTNNWIEGLSNLETIIQDYSNHDEFLKLIEQNSKGDLKAAAKTLRTSMQNTIEIKLDTYNKISDKNFKNYEELFFSDIFFAAVKQTSEYEADDSLHFFVDCGEGIISKINLGKDSWELGTMIGTLVGNTVVGGENLINRLLETMALYDISEILKNELLEKENSFLANYKNKTAAEYINDYILFSQYLLGCRIRGEYCMYSIVANDSGLLSWFNKKSAAEAKQWYVDKSKKILNVQKKLKKISVKDSNATRYKAYYNKVQEYESTYGVGSANKESEYSSYMTGLCFIKLVDFLQDGQEELLLVYQTMTDSEYEMYRSYHFEIWNYENGEMVLLDSGEPFGTDGGVYHVYLTKVNNKIYLITGGTDSFGYYYYHGYSNNNFGIVKKIIWEEGDNGYICSIDGKSVTYDTLEAEQKKWFDPAIEYDLSLDCNKILDQNKQTKNFLSEH